LLVSDNAPWPPLVASGKPNEPELQRTPTARGAKRSAAFRQELEDLRASFFMVEDGHRDWEERSSSGIGKKTSR
jgi:hypothetical protein